MHNRLLNLGAPRLAAMIAVTHGRSRKRCLPLRLKRSRRGLRLAADHAARHRLRTALAGVRAGLGALLEASVEAMAERRAAKLRGGQP